MSHSKPPVKSTTARGPVELPEPAWGSPAHLAKQRAEKEWKHHLRVHATADAAKRASGKHTRYVDGVDILVRYEMPPAWELLEGGVAKHGDDLWVLPDDDETLVKILKASSAPFFQRTGDFAKPSTAFKTPPIAKSPNRVPSPLVEAPNPARVKENEPLPVINPVAPVPTPEIREPTNAPEIALKSSDVAKPTAAAQPPLPSSSTNNTYSSNNVAKESDSTTVQPRRTYLPVAVSNIIYKVGQMFLWFIPGPLRARLNIWWSPVLRTPARGDGRV